MQQVDNKKKKWKEVVGKELENMAMVQREEEEK